MRGFLFRLGAAVLAAAATGAVLAGLWNSDSSGSSWTAAVLGVSLVFIFALPFHLFYGIPASYAVHWLSSAILPSSARSRIIIELLVLYPAAGILPNLALGAREVELYSTFAASALLFRLMLLLLEMLYYFRSRPRPRQ